jgi:hypothetical protein
MSLDLCASTRAWIARSALASRARRLWRLARGAEPIQLVCVADLQHLRRMWRSCCGTAFSRWPLPGLFLSDS